jgi:hypothetical protein
VKKLTEIIQKYYPKLHPKFYQIKSKEEVKKIPKEIH